MTERESPNLLNYKQVNQDKNVIFKSMLPRNSMLAVYQPLLKKYPRNEKIVIPTGMVRMRDKTHVIPSMNQTIEYKYNKSSKEDSLAEIQTKKTSDFN